MRVLGEKTIFNELLVLYIIPLFILQTFKERSFPYLHVRTWTDTRTNKVIYLAPINWPLPIFKNINMKVMITNIGGVYWLNVECCPEVFIYLASLCFGT